MDAKSSVTTSDYDGSSNVDSFGTMSQVGMIVPTVSEEEQQGARTNGTHLSSLPRSVRWRIQLGLLQDPSKDIVANDVGINSVGRICNLETLTDYNHDAIFKQAERFKCLVEKYVEETIEIDNEKQSASSSPSTENKGSDDFESSSKPAEIDPLTAMVMEQEAQETRKAELYLKYRKERARRKRGLATEARVIESENDEVDQASVSTFQS